MGAVDEGRLSQIRRRLINFTTERWDSLAHHREDAEDFHGHAAGDILWLLDEVDRLNTTIARNLERAAFDDYNAMHLGKPDVPCWADLPDAEREVYRGAVAADFWREA